MELKTPDADTGFMICLHAIGETRLDNIELIRVAMAERGIVTSAELEAHAAAWRNIQAMTDSLFIHTGRAN